MSVTPKAWMEHCRSATLHLFDQVDQECFCAQGHPEFSPIGWHLGHIGYTEALWVLGKGAGMEISTLKLPIANGHQLFAVENLPKSQRTHLPSLALVKEYLEAIRAATFFHLDRMSEAESSRIWAFLLQHESQHREIISFVLHMQGHAASGFPSAIPTDRIGETCVVTAGYFAQGSQDYLTLDNEREPFSRFLPAYTIDAHPVTRGQYRSFLEQGGYDNPRWWTARGWEWRTKEESHTLPRFWSMDSATLDEGHPVYGVSWYEADAYTRFVGKQLPSEAQWEKAASVLPSINLVWEWTSTLFHPYPGFMPFPYPGYSQDYFDQQHYVLKGGSWQSQPWTIRPSFRNWYLPHIRDIFAGFRGVSL